jgi:hypothetical protein
MLGGGLMVIDLGFLGLAAVFFAATFGLIAVCERLMEG